MNTRSQFSAFCISVFGLATASPALGLANRVFVSARSGNDANLCDNILAPCQTFVGAVTKLNPGDEVIVLASGGYGPVTLTRNARYSNCVFANNQNFGVLRVDVGAFESRGNNTITGNTSGPTSGVIGLFPAT